MGFDADLAQVANTRALWDAANGLLPTPPDTATAMPRYTQGMMDLGATVCLPKNPLCAHCPVARFCVAGAAGNPQKYPVRTRKLKRSSQSIWLLWLQTQSGAIWLDRRPTPGVWAGLHCLPLFDSEDALRAAVPAHLHAGLQMQTGFMHVLTHKDLHLHPWHLAWPTESSVGGAGRWVDAQGWPALGLPAPIRRLLELGRVS
jgi:A/G-specific adenine glycosylase